MHKTVIEFNQSQRTKKYPAFRGGDVVKVSRKIIEGEKERTQVFEGMIIAQKGGQNSSPTITVRKVSSGVGVELIIPIHSPQVENIEIIKRAKIHQSKLYYVRERSAKSLRFKFNSDPSLNDVVAETTPSDNEKTQAENEQSKDEKNTDETTQKNAPVTEKKETKKEVSAQNESDTKEGSTEKK